MAYKMGFILSLIFIVQLFLMAGDLMAIQIIYTNLDSLSLTAGTIISEKCGITQEVIELVEREGKATIVAIGDVTPIIGSVFEFKLMRDYNPYIISTKPVEVAVTRSVVLGYYN